MLTCRLSTRLPTHVRADHPVARLQDGHSVMDDLPWERRPSWVSPGRGVSGAPLTPCSHTADVIAVSRAGRVDLQDRTGHGRANDSGSAERSRVIAAKRCGAPARSVERNLPDAVAASLGDPAASDDAVQRDGKINVTSSADCAQLPRAAVDSAAGLARAAQPFAGWAPPPGTLVTGSEIAPVLRPTYALPAGNRWPRVPITLLGDAARRRRPSRQSGDAGWCRPRRSGHSA